MTKILQPDTDTEKRRDRRADRWTARNVLWQISGNSRTRGCGRVGVLAGGGVAVRQASDGRAGFAGLATCGSVWACPVCAEKILAARQEEMTAALAAHAATGGRVAMVTMTMRHRDGQALADLWDGLTYAWHSATHGRAWDRDQAAYGVLVDRVIIRGARRGQIVTEPRIGFIKIVETTHGAHGWHVHVHAALMLPGTITAKEVDYLACAMFQRWSDALQRKGFDAPLSRSGGLDARLWNGVDGVDVYFTKQRYQSNADRFAMELARGDLKKARGGNRSPFQILADIAESYSADDGDRWYEWEKASHGRRQVSWSVGLRDRLIPDIAEKTDEELAEETIEAEAVVVLTAAGVATMSRCQLGVVVLDALELGGRIALVAVLDHYGIEWNYPTAALTRDTRLGSAVAHAA